MSGQWAVRYALEEKEDHVSPAPEGSAAHGPARRVAPASVRAVRGDPIFAWGRKNARRTGVRVCRGEEKGLTHASHTARHTAVVQT